MNSPFSALMLVLLISATLILFLLIQVGALGLAFQKMGLSPQLGMFIFVLALVGSVINIPLFRIKSRVSAQPPPTWAGHRLWRPWVRPFDGWTIVAVNVGGCIIPLLVVLFLLFSQSLDLFRVTLAVVVVTFISYSFSQTIPGLGIGMPIFIAPLTAVVAAGLLYPEHRGAVAYICGTLGVLIGADLLRLKEIRELGTPVASIGGAGTFDGIFFTGILAVLLA